MTVVASVVIAGLNVAGPMIYSQLINKAASLSFWDWVLWGGFWSLISLVAIYIEKYVSITKYDLAIVSNIDMDIDQFENKNRLSVLYHTMNNAGEVNERITKAGSYLGLIISDVFFALLPDVITLAAVAIVVFFTVSHAFSLIILTVMLLHITVTIRAARVLAGHEKESREEYKKAVGYMHDIGVNILTVKAFCLENLVAQKLKMLFGGFKEASGQYIKDWAKGNFYQKSILSLGSISLLIFAGFIMGQKEISNGQLAMIMVYTSLVFKPFASLSSYYLMIKRAEVSINEGKELLNEKPESYNAGTPIDRNAGGKIEFRNVSYAYAGNTLIVKAKEGENDETTSVRKSAEAVSDINIEFPPEPGLYGTIGQSGSGKSTLWKLLVNFYQSNRGKILVGGKDTRYLNLSSLRKYIVFAESTPLFDGTIEDNIRAGNRVATIIDVMEAAKAAGVHDDIIRRGGYGQNGGTLGSQLSKGEIQRIIIARALLNSVDAEVLIFDEPTINLDNLSVARIKRTFEELAKYKKVIIITHDINFVDNAKEIIVMKNGRMAEKGSLKELLELNGIGAELFNSQNKHTIQNEIFVRDQ